MKRATLQRMCMCVCASQILCCIVPKVFAVNRKKLEETYYPRRIYIVIF